MNDFILNKNGILYMENIEIKELDSGFMHCFNPKSSIQAIRTDFPEKHSLYIIIDEDKQKVIMIAKRGSIKISLPNGIWHPLNDNISLCSYKFWKILENPKQQKIIIETIKKYLQENS